MSEHHLNSKMKLIFILIGVLLLVGIGYVVWAYQTGRLGTKADTGGPTLPAGATAKGKVTLTNISATEQPTVMKKVSIYVDYPLTELANPDMELPTAYHDFMVTPNARGEFSIGPLPMGRTIVLGATNGINSNIQITQTPGTEVTFPMTQNFTLDVSTAVGKIHIQAMDKGFMNISGANITLTPLAWSQNSTTKQLNSSGVADFDQVPPGQYLVFVEKTNDDQSIKSYSFGDQSNILVHPGESVNLNLKEVQ